jgi:chromosome segregation ATPase
MKILARVITITVLIVIIHNAYAQDQTKKVQQLHQVISNDLIKIRKTFPNSQRTVYSLLDQVCKIYKISKEKIETEQKLKGIVKEKVTEIVTLKKENSQLKTKLENLKGKLNTTQETLQTTSKKLKSNKTAFENLKKEKNKIEAEKILLAQEREKLIRLQEELQQKPQNNKRNQALVKNHKPYNPSHTQSLNLTSTSEPISPL